MPDSASGDDAAAACAADGGYLVSISSATENDFVSSLYGYVQIYLLDEVWYIH